MVQNGGGGSFQGPLMGMFVIQLLYLFTLYLNVHLGDYKI